MIATDQERSARCFWEIKKQLMFEKEPLSGGDMPQSVPPQLEELKSKYQLGEIVIMQQPGEGEVRWVVASAGPDGVTLKRRNPGAGDEFVEEKVSWEDIDKSGSGMRVLSSDPKAGWQTRQDVQIAERPSELEKDLKRGWQGRPNK